MPDSLQLFTAQSGQLSAKILFTDGTIRHLHSMVDPGIESDNYEELSFWGDVVIFAGIGLGYHIVQKVKAIPPDAAIVVIDYYNELLDHCRENVFKGLPNRTLYLSASNMDADAGAFPALITAAAASIQIVKHPASYYAHEDFYAAAIRRLWDARPRPAGGRKSAPKSALMFYGNFFLEQEALGALKSQGIEPVVFSYTGAGSRLAYDNELQRLIQTKRPDFILSINMKGFDGQGVTEEITGRFGVPLIVWFVDDPRPILMHRLSYVKKHMLAACWERSYLRYLRDAGFSSAAYAPLATDPALFSPGGQAPPSVNIGFVGTAMVDCHAGAIRDKFLWSDTLEPLVERVSERLLDDPAIALNMEKTIAACAWEAGLTLPFSDMRNATWLASYCIHTASMKKRKRIIGSLLGEGIETFGDPEGWKALLGPCVPTHPDIDYRRELRDAYRGIRCNVNITSCQMPTAVNQRAFDIPCCGGFVVSDSQPDMRELFKAGEEAVVYENAADLKEKIAYYLARDGARQSITSAAQKRILREHTYAHRLRNIIQLLK